MGSSRQTQVKSRERVREHGEVFTAEREVKAMCDLVGDVGSNPTDGTVLEPACGDGNFLVEILNRKCDRLYAAGCRAGGRPMKWSWRLADKYAFRLAGVLSLLYGIDILADNVYECRKRLSGVVLARFDAVVKGRDGASRVLLERAADVITGINIVCGNALTMKCHGDAPIVFVKWRMEESGDRYRVGVTPYYFEKIVGDDGLEGDLFKTFPKLDRSPQISFREIEKAREYAK